MSSLDLALQRALSVRLNLQISLSQLPIVMEWMDIHLDRWLEHNPMPMDMGDGQELHYLAMVGSDLQRVWWGSWGDPSGFIPKMADYFKLCNIAKSDARVLDQVGEHLEPKQVGSWIGVWGGKVTTGWHFYDPQPWSKVEQLFGTHEAKFQLKSWIEANHVENIERFTQSIGDTSYSELEIAMPGADAVTQVAALSDAFQHFTNAPLASTLVERLRNITEPGFALALRIRGGAITRVGALAPGIAMTNVEALCEDAKVPVDKRFSKIVGSLGNKVERVEYGRAGDRAGVDVYVEPTDPPAKAGTPAMTPPTAAN